jgi:inner membrane protein
MDSITQIALGASVAATVGFKPFGRKVLLAGALLGTLPDLDVFIDYGNAIDNYTSHRGFSHSLFVLTLLSVMLYFIFLLNSNLKVKACFQDKKLALFLTLFLPLITHPLLDSFTTYGTQLFWPLTSPPIAWHSVFIIDPLYTLPLLISMLLMWFSHNKKRALMFNKIAILISCSYLAWGQFAQSTITTRVQQENMAQNGKLLVMPTPFNSVYWRILNYQGDSYYEAFTYVGDNAPLHWNKYNSNRALIKHSEPEFLPRLEWFSDGWLRFDDVQGRLQVTDLRLGVANFHPFTFVIAEKENINNSPQWKIIEPMKVVIDEYKQQQLVKNVKQQASTYWLKLIQ